MVSDLASKKSLQRTLRPQLRARRKTDIGTQDDGRGSNRKTPISDLAGKSTADHPNGQNLRHVHLQVSLCEHFGKNGNMGA